MTTRHRTETPVTAWQTTALTAGAWIGLNVLFLALRIYAGRDTPTKTGPRPETGPGPADGTTP